MAKVNLQIELDDEIIDYAFNYLTGDKCEHLSGLLDNANIKIDAEEARAVGIDEMKGTFYHVASVVAVGKFLTACELACQDRRK